MKNLRKCRFAVLFTVLTSMVFISIYARNKSTSPDFTKIPASEILAAIPDSSFENIKIEDLLDDEVYIKLSQDGWLPEEIVTIMNTVMRDKDSAKKHVGYVGYAKQWLPSYGRIPGGDTIYELIDTTFTPRTYSAIINAVGEDTYNKSWPLIIYDPSERMRKVRNPGYFRQTLHKPSSSRMHWMALHPTCPDSLYAKPDGGGIFVTADKGRSWRNITDNIPDRRARTSVSGYAIPVDPKNFSHVFGFMADASVWESFDAGNTWAKVQGATHKSFKRGYCFRNSAGDLKLIGAVPNGGKNYWNTRLWISEDKGVTWTEIIPDASIIGVHPLGLGTGCWFQQVEFDAQDPDRIYIPGSNFIYYFDDGATPTINPNGTKTYNLKRLDFDVYDNAGNLRCSGNSFPLAMADVPGFMAVNPFDSNEMWFACGVRATNQTALYVSYDRGRTWETRMEPSAGIGSGCVFGNETPYSWLGGFGVNWQNPDQVFGCVMNSAYSIDGGRTFLQYPWSSCQMALNENGTYTYTSNSRHNADNHSIFVHPLSGDIYRCSDGGLFKFNRWDYTSPGSPMNSPWENIGSNMGAMLYYAVRVNEFGDQCIIGNTQDIDVQTYRYGRWGKWRGYEGCEVVLNPYTGNGYFSGSNGGGFEDMEWSSWRSAVAKADVFTGSWYMTRTRMGDDQSFFRIDDVGRSCISLYPGVGEGVAAYALARDKGHTTIFVRTNSNYFKLSTDGGNTFTPILYNGAPAKFSNAVPAADPNNSDILYLGQAGRVLRWYINESRVEEVGSGLPEDLACSDLLFHEGSGDLYFTNTSSGIYILENGSDTWRFWTKGYNAAGFNNAVINYTTQEMVLSAYGPGCWVADLEHPADRFFSDGFKLKELSNVNGRRTIGIDTPWTIPLYYNYSWTVNDKPIDNPWQYLTADLNPSDRVKLTLTLRESPDVTTVSSEFTVAETEPVEMIPTPGHALASDGQGRIDLGYNDYFHADFTIDFWLKPGSDGVIMANRQFNQWGNKGTKGWALYVSGGNLYFQYAPKNYFFQPTYEAAETQIVNVNGGPLTMGKWQHVALTHSLDGSGICIYVNGRLTGSGSRITPEHSLNNTAYLSLFADAWEYTPITAAVDELKMWNRSLPIDEVRREIYSTNTDSRPGLVTRFDFNGPELANDAETFTGLVPRVRIRAQVTHPDMPEPICARYSAYGAASSSGTLFSDGEEPLLKASPKGAATINMGVFVYDSPSWITAESNLDPDYYDVFDDGFVLRLFDSYDDKATVDLDFYSPGSRFNDLRDYRLYTAPLNDVNTHWTNLTPLTFNSEDGTVRAENMRIADIRDRRLIVVAARPGIEVNIHGLDSQGQLVVYSEEDLLIDIDARLQANLNEPVGLYTLISNNNVLQPLSGFYFTKGEASAKLKLETDLLPPYNESIDLVLRGMDEKMVPIPIKIINRIAPKEIGHSALLSAGGLTIPAGDTFRQIESTNNFTMMGWFRIDDPEMLTGSKYLMDIRGTGNGTAGILLTDGNMRFNWSSFPSLQTFTSPTTWTLTENDLGRWNHFAVVMTPSRCYYYFNGEEAYYSRNYSVASLNGPLRIGKFNDDDTYFTGAVDQVAVINRALSHDEVINAMHNRPDLSDQAVVSFINMDFIDDDNVMRDARTSQIVNADNGVTLRHRSTIPYNSSSAAKSNVAGQTRAINLAFSGAAPPYYHIFSFQGLPYNYLTDNPEYLPLNPEHYSIVYPNATSLTNAHTVTVTYTHPSVLEGDQIVMGIRRLGSENAFSTLIESSSVSAGSATFAVPGNLLKQASEAMFYVTRASGERPTNITASFGADIVSGQRLMIDEDTRDVEIPVNFNIISGNLSDQVLIEAVEDYASVSRTSVDMTKPSSTIILSIDRRLIDTKAVNPVTLRFAGADIPDLTLEVYLEPTVELRLTNGNSANSMIATSLYPTLEIEAELIDGYLEGEVELSTIADISTSMSIGSGTLLTDRDVTFDNLNHVASPSPDGSLHEGWNLIGNPYLTNINLTKVQNVVPQKMTKFIYQYDPALRNFTVYDMTQYDEHHSLLPLQPCFVQTIDTDATLTVTPVAKERKASKKTLSFYAPVLENSLTLQLLTNDAVTDRTKIVYDPNANENYITGEDASKMASLSQSANSLWTLAPGNIPLALNYAADDTRTIPLVLNLNTNGDHTLLVENNSGCDKAFLHDKLTDHYKPLTSGASIILPNDLSGNIADRYEIVNGDKSITGVEAAKAYDGYQIWVDGHECIIDGLLGDAFITIFMPDGTAAVYDHTAKPSSQYSLDTGIYLVQIKENNKVFTAKILIRP